MPAQTFVTLLLIVLGAAGLTIFAAVKVGLPLAALGLVFAIAALALRIRMNRP